MRPNENSGIFTIRDVSPGRHHLLFNLEGAQETVWNPPFESVYHPRASTRANAKVIEIDGSGNHLADIDLIAGARVPFRDMAVGVRFPDGEPMTTTRIRVTGEPLTKEADEWVSHLFISKKGPDGGWARVRVPANRKIRGEVRDSWRRDMKRKYVAEFEAGRTAIEKAFVIQP